MNINGRIALKNNQVRLLSSGNAAAQAGFLKPLCRSRSERSEDLREGKSGALHQHILIGRVVVVEITNISAEENLAAGLLEVSDFL